jgi:hypothetical protein
LSLDLSRQPSFWRWVLDLSSPGLLRLARAQMGSMLDQASAPLQFAPADGEEFFRPHGWRPVSSQSLLQTAVDLGRLSADAFDDPLPAERDARRHDIVWSGVCVFENSVATRRVSARNQQRVSPRSKRRSTA